MSETEDQSVNERTLTVIDFSNLFILSFPYAGGLWRPIERFAIASFFSLCRDTYIVNVARGEDVTERPKGNFPVSAGHKVVV